MGILLWLFLHWKLAALIAGAGLVAACIFLPAFWRLVWRRRLAIAIAGLRPATHGLVAVATRDFFDERARVAELERERDEARLVLRVLQEDADEAAIQSAALNNLRRRNKELSDALSDPDFPV